MAEGSGLSAIIHFDKVPVIIDDMKSYVDKNSVPGGTNRNWDSYGEKIGSLTDYQKSILADPQTSGGLLIAVDKNAAAEVKNILQQNGLQMFCEPVGEFVVAAEKKVIVI